MAAYKQEPLPPSLQFMQQPQPPGYGYEQGSGSNDPYGTYAATKPSPYSEPPPPFREITPPYVPQQQQQQQYPQVVYAPPPMQQQQNMGMVVQVHSGATVHDANAEQLSACDLDCECCLYTIYAAFCPCIVFGEAHSMVGPDGFCSNCSGYLAALIVDNILGVCVVQYVFQFFLNMTLTLPTYVFPCHALYHGKKREDFMRRASVKNYNSCFGDSCFSSFICAYLWTPCALAQERRIAGRYLAVWGTTATVVAMQPLGGSPAQQLQPPPPQYYNQQPPPQYQQTQYHNSAY